MWNHTRQVYGRLESLLPFVIPLDASRTVNNLAHSEPSRLVVTPLWWGTMGGLCTPRVRAMACIWPRHALSNLIVFSGLCPLPEIQRFILWIRLQNTPGGFAPMRMAAMSPSVATTPLIRNRVATNRAPPLLSTPPSATLRATGKLRPASSAKIRCDMTADKFF